MPGKRFLKKVTDLEGKSFFKMIARINKLRPDGMKIPKAAIVDPKYRLEELPFTSGDRVQITRGSDKGKVGYIIDRYPNFGNAFFVAGVGSSKTINPVENRTPGKEDDYLPVMDVHKVFDFRDLRLVKKIKNEKGEDEDVAIYDVALGPEKYDPLTNTHRRIRYAKYDKNMVLPWPGQRVKEIVSDLTTTATVADLRSHFVTSVHTSPVPIGAVDQIINPHNRYKRSRYVKPLTETEAAKLALPEMPLPPRTKKLLEQLAALPKPKPVEFTREIEDFLGVEIRKGLERRVAKETEAIKDYK